VTERTKEHASGAGGTNARAAAWLVWSLAALSVAMFVTTSVLSVLAQSAQSQDQSTLVGAISETVGFVLFLAFPIVGALVAFGRPQNPIGWILLADGLLWMLLAVTGSYDLYGVSSPGSVPFPVTVGALGNIWLWVPTVGLLGTYLLLLFPDGKLPSKR
jgi:MFS-type transporter involved in bile tolerance (Atg22 family)